MQVGTGHLIDDSANQDYAGEMIWLTAVRLAEI